MIRSKFEIKKLSVIILAINVIQIGLLAFLLLFSFFSSEFYEFWGVNSQVIIILITITSLVNGFISIRDINFLMRSHLDTQLLRDTINSLERYNDSILAQRHDFLNHLQVVYGLMQMEEYKDAQNYIDKVYDDIQKVSRILRTANPAVNALLQAKMLNAETKGILMEVYVASRLDNMPVPSWDLCRVLGNLLDNAIFALGTKKENPLLKLSFKEDLDSFIICVENNGPAIPEKHIDKIFQHGFTTKGENGEGIGLAIVKNILGSYGGRISVESVESLTLFTISIPRKHAIWEGT